MSDPRDELARLTALCEQATAGPWSVHDCGEVIARGEDWLVADVCQWWADTRLVDGYFIAESRSALPAALACLTELLDLPEQQVARRMAYADVSAVQGYNAALDEIRAVIAKHFPGGSHE